jgi:hypothetical protein
LQRGIFCLNRTSVAREIGVKSGCTGEGSLILTKLLADSLIAQLRLFGLNFELPLAYLRHSGLSTAAASPLLSRQPKWKLWTAAGARWTGSSRAPRLSGTRRASCRTATTCPQRTCSRRCSRTRKSWSLEREAKRWRH